MLYFPWAPELKRCPNAYLTADVWTLVEMWTDWKVFRALPYPGDLFDQPAYVVDVIRRCEETLIDIREETRKREHEALEKQRQEAMRRNRQRR